MYSPNHTIFSRFSRLDRLLCFAKLFPSLVNPLIISKIINQFPNNYAYACVMHTFAGITSEVATGTTQPQIFGRIAFRKPTNTILLACWYTIITTFQWSRPINMVYLSPCADIQGECRICEESVRI